MYVNFTDLCSMFSLNALLLFILEILVQLCSYVNMVMNDVRLEKSDNL